MCSVITSYTRSFSEGLETKVLGVQSEGLPHGEFLKDPGYLGQQDARPAASARNSVTAAVSSSSVSSRHFAWCRATLRVALPGSGRSPGTYRSCLLLSWRQPTGTLGSCAVTPARCCHFAATTWVTTSPTGSHLLRRLVPQGRVRQVLVAGLRREQPRPELDHRRLSSDAQAAASRIGRIPARDPLGTDGLDIDQDDLNLLLSVDTETWKQEATPISEHLRTFSGHTCPTRSGTSTTICAADLAEPQTMSSFRRPLKRLGVARLDTHPGGGRHASPRIVAPGFPRWYSTEEARAPFLSNTTGL